MKNEYIKFAHISEAKTRAIIRLFSLDVEGEKTAELTGMSRPTISRICRTVRERIYEICEAESPFENGEMEFDGSYFGARRVRGRRGRGALGKTPVFGMLKRGDKVYTQMVKHCSIKELLPIIKDKADPGAVVYGDGYKVYDGLVSYGSKRHHRVNHSESEVAVGRNHINGIENFWGLCKVRLAKFRGIHNRTFVLHIKECEFGYNCRNKNLYLILLRNFRNNLYSYLEPNIYLLFSEEEIEKDYATARRDHIDNEGVRHFADGDSPCGILPSRASIHQYVPYACVFLL